jgi:hypothetical protein
MTEYEWVRLCGRYLADLPQAARCTLTPVSCHCMCTVAVYPVLCPHCCQSTIYELPAHCIFSHHHPLPFISFSHYPQAIFRSCTPILPVPLQPSSRCTIIRHVRTYFSPGPVRKPVRQRRLLLQHVRIRSVRYSTQLEPCS